MVVWLGSIAFDVVSQTDIWVDVLGSSRGWGRTLLDTRRARLDDGDRGRPVPPRGARGASAARTSALAARGSASALVPLAAGWFLAHDLSLLVAEGQNAYILMSDPLGKGWDLFGTINHTIDYGVLQAAWFRWLQLALLVAGHVAAVVVLHDTALDRAAPAGRDAGHVGHDRRSPARRSPPACSWCSSDRSGGDRRRPGTLAR